LSFELIPMKPSRFWSSRMSSRIELSPACDTATEIQHKNSKARDIALTNTQA
jgi:hypothetical protein